MARTLKSDSAKWSRKCFLCLAAHASLWVHGPIPIFWSGSWSGSGKHWLKIPQPTPSPQKVRAGQMESTVGRWSMSMSIVGSDMFSWAFWQILIFIYLAVELWNTHIHLLFGLPLVAGYCYSNMNPVCPFKVAVHRNKLKTDMHKKAKSFNSKHLA